MAKRRVINGRVCAAAGAASASISGFVSAEVDPALSATPSRLREFGLGINDRLLRVQGPARSFFVVHNGRGSVFQVDGGLGSERGLLLTDSQFEEASRSATPISFLDVESLASTQ